MTHITMQGRNFEVKFKLRIFKRSALKEKKTLTNAKVIIQKKIILYQFNIYQPYSSEECQNIAVEIKRKTHMYIRLKISIH